MTYEEAVAGDYKDGVSMVTICLTYDVSPTKVRAIVRAAQDEEEERT